jgi:hypothetical protein
MSSRSSTWQVPAQWWRRGEAVHGRTPTPAPSKAPLKPDAIDGLIERVADQFDAVLDHPATPPEWADAARAFVAGHHSPTENVTPLAAAAAWMVSTQHNQYKMRTPFVVYLIGRFGAAFAAEAVVVAAGMTIEYHPSPQPRTMATSSLSHRIGMDTVNFWVDDAYSRVRSALAALSDDEYAAVAERLAEFRGSCFARRIATSFLLPTEHDWVAADLQKSSGLDRYQRSIGLVLLASVSDVAAVETAFELVEDRARAIWNVGIYPRILHAMCANIGPGLEPIVGEIFDGNLSSANKKRCAEILAEFDTDAGVSELLDRLGTKHIEPAVLDAMDRAPERAARMLEESDKPLAGALLRDLYRTHPELAGPESRDEPATLSASAVPTLLASPPWLGPRKASAPVVIDVDEPSTDLFTAWLPGEREEWAAAGTPYPPSVWRKTWADFIKEVTDGHGRYPLSYVAHAPDDIIRPLLPTITESSYLWQAEGEIRRILARFDVDAAHYVLRTVITKPAQTVHVLLPVGGSAVARRMVDWLQARSVRASALEWFDRHIDSAAPDVVASVLRQKGAPRLAAERGIRTLARRGNRDVLVSAAGQFGPKASAVVATIVDTDPLLVLPRTIPTTPAWLDPALLPPLVLRDTEAPLPTDAVQNVLVMFAMSRMDEVYAGIDILRDLVDTDDLAVFVWDVFERWAAAGFPDAQNWALDALGIVGNDDTARRLTPLIRTWPLQSAHRRAAAGLEALATIGTDAALGHLWTISQALRFPALRAKADTRIRRIADELNLTPLDLADRLVPNLGLDPDGTTTFDYGDRSFVATFDHRLSLVIVDRDGKTRDRLARPGQHDSDLAREEYKRYTTLRKDLGAVSGELIARFEKAMVAHRTWRMGQVRTHLVAHPLTWHVVSRLVWSTGSGTQFQFSDLRSPIDADGAHVEIADEVDVAVVHPLSMGDALGTWQHVLDAAMVQQPFEQVHRAVFSGDVQDAIARLEGRKASTRQLLSLKSRGWIREEPQDKGAQISLEKRVTDAVTVSIMVFPGFNAAQAVFSEIQKIVYIAIGDDYLTPIDSSELQRDLSTIDTQPIRGDEPELQGEP